MALALMAFLTRATAASRRDLIGRHAILSSSFVVAVVACFAIKIIAVSAVFKVDAFSYFSGGLMHRFCDSIVPEASPRIVQYLALHGVDVARHPVAYLIVTYAHWSKLIGWEARYSGAC